MKNYARTRGKAGKTAYRTPSRFIIKKVQAVRNAAVRIESKRTDEGIVF
ncbi:hypothetical protein HY732_04635 [Candidatus Uhrbacteria bacterium]|nr:hypothetical protein [Candidatus Uhrbacteria bacterium]